MLIRHLTEDDPAQLKIARAELAKAERRGDRIWLSLLVLVETAWVLSAYGLKKLQILEVLESVIADTRFEIEGGNVLSKAIRRAREKGDLPEHIAALAARASGVVKTQTFDKDVRRFADFEIL